MSGKLENKTRRDLDARPIFTGDVYFGEDHNGQWFIFIGKLISDESKPVRFKVNSKDVTDLMQVEVENTIRLPA